MDLLSTFCTLLDDAAHDRRSLVISLAGSSNGHPWRGSADLLSGTLADLRIHGLQGRESLSMLSGSRLTDVRVGLGAPTTIVAGTPSITEVLDLLGLMILRERYSAQELLTHVLELVTNLLGPRAAQEVVQAAGQISPEGEPRAFLTLCEDMIAPMLGRPQAQAVFRPLYS